MFSGSLKQRVLSLVFMCGLSVCVWAQDAVRPQDRRAISLQRQFVKLSLQAEQGDADAQYTVGMMYYAGQQVPQNKTLAVIWLEKAARQGQSNAQYFLSLMYGLADGVAQNQRAAVRWCRAAAGGGHPDAQYSLGRMYATGQGVPRDDIQAVRWLTKAAEEGHADAQCDLGSMYQGGRGVECDMNQAIQWWLKASQQGHAWSALLLQEAMKSSDLESLAEEPSNKEEDDLLSSFGEELGLIEKPGPLAAEHQPPATPGEPVKPLENSPARKIEQVSKNINSAKDIAPPPKPANAETGSLPPPLEADSLVQTGVESAQETAINIPQPQDPPPVNTKEASAHYDLAVQYYEGNGVQQDYPQALKWFQEAAQQGHPQAQYKLGVMYSFGQGVPQNSSEAVKWFRKAAEQGLPAAQYSLGVMYATGQGVELDPVAAAELYTRAAEQGSVAAQYILGVIYSKGEGVTRDSETAVQWYTRAAEQGSPAAQYLLGVLYEKGQGVVIPDQAEALKWYTQAAERGHAEAQYDLAVKYMTGQGAEKDFVQAYTWCLLAALNKKNVASQERWLEERMTAEQLEQSRLLAKEILKK